MTERRAVLAGSGITRAKHEVDNHSLSRVLETSDEWIRERSGIAVRRYVDPGTGSADLGAEAAKAALADAGVEPAEIDYVVCATMTPDHYFPGSGTLVQDLVGIPPVPALDIRQQCAGFAYGLHLVDVLVRSGAARTVLLVGTDVHSALIPFSQRSWDLLYDPDAAPIDREELERNSAIRHLLVLFGDGAGAMVFRAAENGDGRGILGARLYGDGGQKEILHVPGVGSKYRPFVTAEMIAKGDSIPVMDGRQVFKLAVTRMPEATREVLAGEDLTVDDLDLLVMHQANLRINDATRKALGLAEEKVHNNIQHYGNTTSATLPLAFHEAREAGKAPEGSLVAFAALGAGLHWGAVLMRV